MYVLVWYKATGTGGLLSGMMMKPERMNGWQSSVDVVDVAEASRDKRAVEMT